MTADNADTITETITGDTITFIVAVLVRRGIVSRFPKSIDEWSSRE